MTDQPVTPDREALITATTDALHEICGSYDQPADHLRQAYRVVDALLPLLTEALDQARKQGEETGREKAAQALNELTVRLSTRDGNALLAGIRAIRSIR